jgi:hypothetical protein
MRIKKLILASLLCIALLTSYGCGFLAGAAAGGAGGYILRDQGYKVRPPIKKETGESGRVDTPPRG